MPSLSWTGGQLVDSDFTVPTNAVLTLSGAADKTLRRSMVNNAGTITWTGTGSLVAAFDNYHQGVLITNLAGGLFDLQTDASFGYSNPNVYYQGVATGDVTTANAARVIAMTAPSVAAYRNAAPFGAITAANATTLSGWAIDGKALASSLTISVTIDGVSAGTMVAVMKCGLPGSWMR